MNIFNPVRKFSNFDKITEFRLYNAFIVAIALSLIGPVLIILKGTLLTAWIISTFSIINMLAVKTNNFFVNKFSMSTLFKMGIMVHIFLLLSSILYFVNPLIMVWLDSFIVILDIAVFSAYSIILNNYITDNFPDSMKDFQIVRNGSYADGALIGLGITTLITFFLPLVYTIIFFIIFNTIFSAWLLMNWNFYDKLKY